MPVASFTATKLRWLRDAEPENAARVAAVALPHDWLTWRLLGYGPADESPLGPDLDALVTDRSDASGTSYWTPSTGEYDRELLTAALGHDAILPRVLGPAEAAGRTPDGILVGPGAGDLVDMEFGAMNASALGLADLDMHNTAVALLHIDDALAFVTEQRVQVGAYSNRMDAAASNTQTKRWRQLTAPPASAAGGVRAGGSGRRRIIATSPAINRKKAP